MEDPVDGVVVVADRRDGQDHQLAGAARSFLVRVALVVLPEQAAIPLIDAEGRAAARRARHRRPQNVASISVAYSGASVLLGGGAPRDPASQVDTTLVEGHQPSGCH